MNKFCIITPTLNRPSLLACCASVERQTYTAWHHIVSFDGVSPDPSAVGKLTHPQRKLFVTRKTGAWGNFQRRMAWKHVNAEYVLYLDCDNTLAHPDALKDIASRLELAGNPAWALFPIHRHGSIFLMEPPGMCRTDTANMVIRREFGQWPDTDAREADGMLADQLEADHPYVAFGDCTAIIMMERSSNGV